MVLVQKIGAVLIYYTDLLTDFKAEWCRTRYVLFRKDIWSECYWEWGHKTRFLFFFFFLNQTCKIIWIVDVPLCKLLVAMVTFNQAWEVVFFGVLVFFLHASAASERKQRRERIKIKWAEISFSLIRAAVLCAPAQIFQSRVYTSVSRNTKLLLFFDTESLISIWRRHWDQTRLSPAVGRRRIIRNFNTEKISIVVLFCVVFFLSALLFRSALLLVLFLSSH